jgi:hypothetical protein
MTASIIGPLKLSTQPRTRMTRPFQGPRVDFRRGEVGQRSSRNDHREVGTPVFAEVEIPAIAPARRVDDPAFDQLEAAGGAPCLVGGAHPESRIPPQTRARRAGLVLDGEHVGGERSRIGRHVNTRESSPEQLTLYPEAVVAPDLRQQTSVPIPPRHEQIETCGVPLHKSRQHRLGPADRRARSPCRRELGGVDARQSHGGGTVHGMIQNQLAAAARANDGRRLSAFAGERRPARQGEQAQENYPI